ncbi:MAG: TIGR03435 family protein, partial [Acidobacteriota bacterium]
MRIPTTATLFASFTATLAMQVMGQAVPPTPLQFVVADVHVSTKADRDLSNVMRSTQMEMRNVTMLTLIQRAYATGDSSLVDAEKVVGGPRWLELNNYVVVARTPTATTKVQDIPPMLKTLLTERFGLVVHEEERPIPTYVLLLGKGKHKLKASDGSDTRCSMQGPAADRRFVQHLGCHGYTISSFAEIVRSLGDGVVTGRVQDKTG